MGFDEDVWNKCKLIPIGKVSTYKEIAHALGTKAYRAVGNALNRNPCGFWKCCRGQQALVPCHRVVNSDGKLGGFASGTKKKIAILKSEGVDVYDGKIKDFKKKFVKIR